LRGGLRFRNGCISIAKGSLVFALEAAGRVCVKRLAMMGFMVYCCCMHK